MTDQGSEGMANQALGKAKEMWGKLTGSKRTEYSGKAENLKGHAQRAVDSATDKVAEHGDDAPR
jgi:uncharacterized protein YjbJ (UPF0337 family)